MFNKKIKIIIGVVVFSLLVTLLAVGVLGAESSYFKSTTVEDGKFVNLPKIMGEVEYTYITLENFNNGLSDSTIDLSSNTFTTIDDNTVLTENGLLYLRVKKSPDKYYGFVYAKGENGLDRSEIGYYGEDDSFVTESKSTLWKAGKWTSTTTIYTGGKNFYLSSEAHVGLALAQDIYNKVPGGDTVNDALANSYRLDAINKFESQSYKYAYESSEIIPAEELYSITYKTNVRQGSLYAYSPSGESLNTKLVLYTMDDSGNIVTHTWFDPASYATYDNNLDGIESLHTAILEEAFPYATGYVIGFEVFPFGKLPQDVQFRAIRNAGASLEFIPVQFIVEYQPSGYKTIWKNDDTKLKFEYNGDNKRYIYGYDDKTFKPDERITRAEISIIIARLLLDSNDIPTTNVSSFTDITADDWYYNAIAYLESIGIYDYISDSVILPDGYITRGELARMLYNASEIKGNDTGDVFSDVVPSHTHYEAIKTLAGPGIVRGYFDDTFRPDAPISRAETVTMINRVINLTVDSRSIDKTNLKNVFEDIEGHWAESHIIMASNDKVKTEAHAKVNSALEQDEDYIYFETNHVKVYIEKDNGKVKSIINKDTNENITSTSVTPWFSTLVSISGINYVPERAYVSDNRLAIDFIGGYKAFFLVESFDNYFTIELDSELPYNIKYIDFASFSVNSEPEDYRISAIPMTTTVDPVSYPGGNAKRTVARAYSAIGDVIGAKAGITFSEYGGIEDGTHREYLKEISLAIDPKVGLTSTHGGAFTYNKGNEDLFGDYVVLHGGITPSTAEETAKIAAKYSVDQLDIHQGASSVIQGNFNFVCAKESGDGDFIDASTFKKRITDVVHKEGVKLGLHTYTSIVDPLATDILSLPKWQKQIAYIPEDVLTLSARLNTYSTSLTVNESLTGRSFSSTGVAWSDIYSGYILIDEEIIRVSSYNASTGKLTVKRGQCGTTATTHSVGSEIRQLLCIYDGFQPIVGSELYYHIADLTAKAYNDGGFDMIYLDGIEGILSFSDKELKYYYYAEFIRRIVSQCDRMPIIEYSDNPPSVWAARGRSGALDYPTRQYKKFILGHVNSNKDYASRFQTSTLGWFDFAPVASTSTGYNYPNTFVKTIFKDDIDYIGTLAIANNMSMAYESFTLDTMTHNTELIENISYFDKYSTLRKSNYFSDSVKDILLAGIKAGKEYKLTEKDGIWGFNEVYYTSNIIRDTSDNAFITKKASNAYIAQSPYVRIEGRYSAANDASEKVVLALDEEKAISSVKGSYSITTTDLTSSRALKVRVHGNNSESDGVLITLKASDSNQQRVDYFIPLNFEGWREIILIDADNGDFDGYKFSGITSGASIDYYYYRNSMTASKVNSVTISLCGSCNGVMIDDIRACAVVNAPAVNPGVTIGDNTITFNTTLNSGEYIEYIPEENKAYKSYYKSYTYTKANGGSATISYQKYTEEVGFSGSLNVPQGDFSYTFSAENSTNAPLRAKVTVGLRNNEFIKN